MHISLPLISKIKKQEENNYVLFGEKIGFRTCNKNCEYLTIFQENDNSGDSYKLGISNLGNTENFDSTEVKEIFGENFKFYKDLSSNSVFYLLNLNQLINNCTESEYIQYGDKVYISSFINGQIFIVGFDQTSGKFLVSRFDEVACYLKNQKEPFNNFLLNKYEWFLEKIPFSKEELMLGMVNNSSIPNTQSVKYSDIFTIKFNSEQLICIGTTQTNLKMQFSQLSIENASLSGSRYWTIIPFKFEGTVYPNWFLMKKILKNKKNNHSMRFLDGRVIEELKCDWANYTREKTEPVQVDTFELISDCPVDWNIPNANFSKEVAELTTNKLPTKVLGSIPSIAGFVFDHAVIGIETNIKQNIIPNKLSSFPIKIQEQLLLEDILNCLLCKSGNYIKVTEQIVHFFHKFVHLDFASEDLYIFEFNSEMNHEGHLKKCFVSGREGMSIFSHQIIDDPGNLKQNSSRDMIFNLTTEELRQKDHLNGLFELKSVFSSNNLKINPSLFPLSYKTLELSSLHRKIRGFLKVHESGNSQFGIISGTLCSSFRELLKHFTIKVAKFEIYLRKGQLTVQNIWSFSQQALVTLRALNFISERVLYKKGCEIIDHVNEIANNEFKGEDSSQKIASFVLSQILLSWYRHFLAPWLKFGIISDHFTEFVYHNDINLKKKLFKAKSNHFQIFCRRQNKKISFLLPLFAQKLAEQIYYIGFVSHFISHICHLYTENQSIDKVNEIRVFRYNKLESYLEQILKSLKKSDLLRIEEINTHIYNMFLESKFLLFRVCDTITDIKFQINTFHEIFFCANDSLIQEFINSIHKLEHKGNKTDNYSFTNITRKWSELMGKYYRDLNGAEISDKFYCIIGDKLITESVKEELFKPVKWEINSVLHQEPESLKTDKLSTSIFGVFKYLTVKFREMKIFNLIWPIELLNKYEIIFRLIFQLKYINHLLNNIWITHQTSNICDDEPTNAKTSISINGIIYKSYFLRQKMLLLITSILEYIYHDVINPLWCSMKQDLNSISTLEELNSCQDKILNEILMQCFFSDSELLNSLYAILSLCHLFVGHSNLLSVYGLTDLAKSNTSNYERKRNKNNFNEGGSHISANDCGLYRQSYFGGSKSRSHTNTHIKSLLAEPTYNCIVEKFSSKFELLICSLFDKMSDSKNKNVNILNKLVLRLNYNSYYTEKVPVELIICEGTTFDEDPSYCDFNNESE